MPPINLIVNGTFDAGATGWSGTDIEANHRESAYLGNGSSNRVAELDGRNNQITVMEQTFTVSGSSTRTVSFDSALRLSSNGNAGVEGFRVEVLDDTGTAIAFAEIRPTNNTLQEFTLPVTFPGAGNYTLRFSERGPNDSRGAIVDNIELMVCFHGETQIATEAGSKAARDIAIGDLVWTENGLKPVRWVGRRRLEAADLEQDPTLRPVRISAGALGQGLPIRDLRVSRQHRMLVHSPVCERMFGAPSAMIAAVRLCDMGGVSIDEDTQEVDYVHLLFDAHEVVFAEGCPSESLLLGPQARLALRDEAIEEVCKIFPQFKFHGFAANSAYHIPERKQQKRLAWRLGKNGRPALQGYRAQIAPVCVA
ncbi:Hint domain-containing protein [Thalassobius sp. Cn5-15]|uniref:Hint domain-containing protein n=1 Tax=Thalassobius sp. Cn5-15 TaxID=2917763 RepID=UPI001EF30951|nr:Hint domain-containing protein [Thalassobius sp. Cn5-15]MCG7493499.1 Hint domain-containing protein [Thalassobius sp. Cn5-15]